MSTSSLNRCGSERNAWWPVNIEASWNWRGLTVHPTCMSQLVIAMRPQKREAHLPMFRYPATAVSACGCCPNIARCRWSTPPCPVQSVLQDGLSVAGPIFHRQIFWNLDCLHWPDQTCWACCCSASRRSTGIPRHRSPPHWDLQWALRRLTESSLHLAANATSQRSFCEWNSFS